MKAILIIILLCLLLVISFGVALIIGVAFCYAKATSITFAIFLMSILLFWVAYQTLQKWKNQLS